MEKQNENQVVEPVEGKEQETNKEMDVVKKYDDNDLNNLLVKERAKMLKDLGVEDTKKAKEFIQKMKDQEEANKTELQKKEEELQAVQGQLNTKDQQIFELNAKFQAIELGVSNEYVDEAIVLAKAKTTEEKDFATALGEVVEKFPNFKNEKTPAKFGAETQVQKQENKKTNNWW